MNSNDPSQLSNQDLAAVTKLKNITNKTRKAVALSQDFNNDPQAPHENHFNRQQFTPDEHDHDGEQDFDKEIPRQKPLLSINSILGPLE